MDLFTSLESKDFSVLLLEHGDFQEDTLAVWTFPSASPQIQHLACIRCAQSKDMIPFLYFKYKSEWVYCLTMPTSFPSVPSASCCLITKNFNPEKWNAMLLVLFEQYSSSSNADPTKILEGYLSVVTTGNFSNAAGTVDISAFPDSDADKHTNVLKELCMMLGIEAVVLWNAVILKKRILVVAESLSELMPVIRTLPQLALHRKDKFSILRPIVSSDQEMHMEDLASAGVWIAGTLDLSFAAQSTNYDVLLNLSESRVIITSHALGDMKMCSAHREIASMMTEMAEGASSSAEIAAAISNRTLEIIGQLREMSGAEKLSESAINSKVSNATMQHWLLKLASAEGLI